MTTPSIAIARIRVLGFRVFMVLSRSLTLGAVRLGRLPIRPRRDLFVQAPKIAAPGRPLTVILSVPREYAGSEHDEIFLTNPEPRKDD